MDCQTVERENIPERYLAGTLEPQLKEQWELHYFNCDHCAELLSTWQAIDQPLRNMAGAIRLEIQPRKATRTWIWAGAAIAAALVLGLAGKLWISPAAPVPSFKTAVKAPDPARFAELARLDPPVFQPNVMRSAESKAETQFQTAMEAYQRRDFEQTIAGLQAALATDPDAAAARFFLGACDLLAGHTADGLRELQRVAAGDSPFAQEAQFDLAKGYLQQGDKQRALATLRPLTETPGDFREPARSMVERLTNVP